jgi:glycosyltransferase involved in cell wall biosynthesis
MRLSIVVPCYNESAVLAGTVAQLRQVLQGLREKGKVDAASNLWLVDDGSSDDTWVQIRSLVAAHAGGFEVVFGARGSRQLDSSFKRGHRARLLQAVAHAGRGVVPDHADFRLLGPRARSALLAHSEGNLFLRGLVPRLGFRSTSVHYDRKARADGSSRYPLGRMPGLGIDGITSFSAVPLRLIAGLGAGLFVLSMVVSAWVLAVRLFTDHAIPGWASTTLPIYALGGVQLLSLGVVGEYVAKVYLEVKRRPRYLVEDTTGAGNSQPPQ